MPHGLACLKPFWSILILVCLGWAILGVDSGCIRVNRGDCLLHAPNPKPPLEPEPHYHPE